MKHRCLYLLLCELLSGAGPSGASPLPPPPNSLQALLQGATGAPRYRALVRGMLAYLETQADQCSLVRLLFITA